jgi:hypothetical protein
MGWTTLHRQTPIKDWYKSEIEYQGHLEVLETRIVHRNELYSAVKDKRDGTIFAMVWMLKYYPKDYYNFGYKDMDETMHPYFYNCPKSILAKLTPTTNEHALEWRQGCINKHTK